MRLWFWILFPGTKSRLCACGVLLFLLWLATSFTATLEGHSAVPTFVLAAIAYLSTGSSQPNRDPSTVAFLIEGNPTNLDPYIDARPTLDRVKI